MKSVITLVILMVFSIACTEGEVIERRSFDSQSGGAVDENLTPKNTVPSVVDNDEVPVENEEDVGGEPESETENETDSEPGGETEPTETEEEGKALGEITNEAATDFSFTGLTTFATHLEGDAASYTIMVHESKQLDIEGYQCVECEGEDDPECINCADTANHDKDKCFCNNVANIENARCTNTTAPGFINISFAKPSEENENNTTDDNAFPIVENVDVLSDSSVNRGLSIINVIKDGVTYSQPLEGSSILFSKLPTSDNRSYEVQLDLKLRELNFDPNAENLKEISYKADLKGSVFTFPAAPEECNEPGKNGKKAVAIYAE